MSGLNNCDMKTVSSGSSGIAGELRTSQSDFTRAIRDENNRTVEVDLTRHGSVDLFDPADGSADFGVFTLRHEDFEHCPGAGRFDFRRDLLGLDHGAEGEGVVRLLTHVGEGEEHAVDQAEIVAVG